MLTEDVAFDVGKMTDRGFAKKSSEMNVSAMMAAEVADAEKERPAKRWGGEVKKTGVAGKKRKKAG
jgi:hypothetical protein